MTPGGSPEVGVLGLGVMGSAMGATLLSRGFLVTGFDIDAERCAEFERRGGRVAESAADLARVVERVIVSLPSVAAFDAACLGVGGLMEGARRGGTVIETSTLPLAAKIAVRDALAEAGVAMIDCPLSGTGDQAARGDVVVFASGAAEDVERCAPIFDGFARSYHHVGAFGTGSKLKLVANLLVAIHNVAAAEALRLAERAGLDLAQTVAVISDSAATSRMFEVRGPKMVTADYEPGVRSAVFEKDLELIAGLVEECSASTPMFDAALPVYALLPSAGHEDHDTAAVFDVLERIATSAAAPRLGHRGSTREPGSA